MTLVTEQIVSYQTFPVRVDPDRTAEELAAFADRYLTGQMIAGRIQDSRLDYSQEPEKLILDGRYDCLEMIGREQTERIGEDHGQASGENG